MPSLLVPVAQWAHRPPHHAISAVLVTKDQRTIVTGSSTGPVVLWSYAPDGPPEGVRAL